MSFIEAVIIAIVEGITEFLPVSSTGHMIITQSLLGLKPDDFTKLFVVNIQFGAILSVLVLYWKRFFQSLSFYYKLFVAVIPAAIIGLLLNDYINLLLEKVWVVAVSLLLGGIVLVFIDKWFKKSDPDTKETSYKSAFIIGIFQCIAMIPGISRSAATIIGGMTQKLSRKKAAEFSFFLAVPTMFGASALELYKSYKTVLFNTDQTVNANNLILLGAGNIVAFIVAMLAIKFFISILTRYGFKWFGYYRILVGVLILVLLAFGYNLQIVG